MARRFIVNNIVNLIKDLGGNPNKFMGTKSNITFLGKGPKGSLFQGQVDIEGLANADFPISRVISEAETAGGYAVANKLNSIQLQRLEQNLTALKKLYFPEPVANITDLGTRTGGLTQEGLGSLRTTQMLEEQRPVMDKAMQMAAADSAAMRKAGLDPSKQADFFKWEEIKKGKGIGSFSEELSGAEEVPTAGLMARLAERMKRIQKMSDELGQIGKGEPSRELTGQSGIRGDIFNDFAGVRSTFNPKNEVHVNKAEALLKDPQIKGLYTEAEVKNAYDFEGLYQSHFDKGHVDVAVLLEQAGHNIPQMRASARDALLQLMKKEGQKGTGLRDFVDEVDFKYISEGGGGRAGDPINLFVKYFGKNAAENLPKNATKENIDVFTDFIVNARDARGRGINDPFFDRESIDFSAFTRSVDEYVPPFKTGGRVGFKDPAGRVGGGMRKKVEDYLTVETGGNEIQWVLDENGNLVPWVGPNPVDEINTINVGSGIKLLLKADGGRVGFKWGSGLSKSLLRKINKKMIKDAVDDIFPTGDYKMDAEIAAEALVENNSKLFGGKLIDDLDDAARSDIYGLVLDEVTTRFGLQMKKKRGITSLIKGVDEQFGEGTLKRASELPKGTKYAELEALKDFEARNRTFTPNKEMIRAKYQGLIDDNLLNQILADNNPQRIAEVLATIDEALLMQGRGMGNESIMTALRDSWGRKKSASGGLAKILEV
jgi:hypothetical protein